jgi:hypothetical protein
MGPCDLGVGRGEKQAGKTEEITLGSKFSKD